MENESTEGRTLTLEVPAALDEWLTERAAALDVERSELVRQLIGGYQVAAETADDESVAALETAIEEHSVDIDAVVEAAIEEADTGGTVDEEAIVGRVLDRLEDRLATLESEREEQLDDIRRRVVQLKEATGSKASVDHTHPELERLDEVVDEVDRLREQVADLDAVDRQEALASELEDVQGKLTQLARVVVELRDADGGADTERERLAHIRRTAAREGFEEAACGACGETLRVGLLPDPACPHCESPFGDIVDGSGSLFGSTPRLVGVHDDRDPDAPSGDGAGTDRAPDLDTETADVDRLAPADDVAADSADPEPGDDSNTGIADGGER
ncbi:hypothetical protein [Haloglomus litoreum]|uniref:hypothetical protein n=1 Tax=Haloglomus litoreum TaxID=3034026 RepID=UPI0023E7B6D5|nr:hypothetical protein [Haloglomus sp. DT116]